MMSEQTLGLKQSGDPKKYLVKELDKLMLFDQSQSSKWPRVTIYIEQAGGVDTFQDENVLIYPNGRTWNIARSINAPVAPEVVDALYQCMGAVMVKDATAATGHASRDVLRYPFRIVDAESITNYDKWKKALEIMRTVQTDTRTREVQGKIVHEVVARYLPEDQVEDAMAMVAWATSENERKSVEAQGMRKDAAA